VHEPAGCWHAGYSLSETEPVAENLMTIVQDENCVDYKPHNVSNKQHRNKPERRHGVSYDIPDEK
jgi:hypothetical protein